MRGIKGFLVALILFMMPFSASAAVYKSGEIQTIGVDETISENVYVAGASVVSRGTIEGDLIGAGSSIVLTGTVTEDVALAGGSVDLIGDVEGDARVVGGNVTVVGNIGGELVVTGGNVHVFSDAVIEDNLVVAGGRVIVDGTVRGDMHFAGGQVDMNGTVDGMMNGWVEDLRLGESGSVGGVLNYHSPRPAQMAQGATVSGPVYFEMLQRPSDAQKIKQDTEEQLFAFMKMFWLMKMLALITAGLALVYMFPLQSTLAVRETVGSFWKNVLWGLLAVSIIPFAGVLLFTTGIGWMLGCLVLTVFALLLFLSGVGGSVAFGYWLEKLVADRWVEEKKDKIAVDWRSVLIGVVTLAFVGLIPVIGWLFVFVWFLAMFGALVRWMARQNGLQI